MQDQDDEVRDRVVFYLELLEDSQMQDEYLANESVFAIEELE